MSEALFQFSENSFKQTMPDHSAKVPDPLKSSFEQMSGLSFKDVHIHYSSSKPAAIGAQAYAAGRHIYLGPGQERHLPHELGHVLQQKQKRVPSTMKIGNIQINQDLSLEREADLLGRQALQYKAAPKTSPLSGTGVENNVIQGNNLFTGLLGGKADQPQEWIESILEALGIGAEAGTTLKSQHMNFNKMNDANAVPGHPYNTFGYDSNTTEATIYDSILAQLTQIGSSDTDAFTPLMQMGAVLNGVSRMLARKLGDMSASDHILSKIMERLSDTSDDAKEVRLRESINAFAQRNPILMYLHNEINSHDASVMLLERSKALGMERPELFRLMERQALFQLRAMKTLQENEQNVSAALTYKLAIDDAAGLYSDAFIRQAITEKGALSGDVDKLHRRFMEIPESAQKGKYRVNPTLEKAQKHEAKSFETIDGESRIKSTLQDKARAGAAWCHHMLYPSEPLKDDGEYSDILNNIVNRLRDAPIAIARFASDLLSRELSADPALRTGALEAGTPFSHITLEELILADREIRRHRPGENLEHPDRYIPARSGPAANTFPYIALLSEESAEGKERGISYPIFRSNKNRLFGGKQPDAPAVFGTLNLLGRRSYHGLKEGVKAGTYGDVVLVFRNHVLNTCVYTLGDRMRGYTRLDAFVYNAFAMVGDGNMQESYSTQREQEFLIPGNKSFLAQKDLILNLFRLEYRNEFIGDFNALEVQIFDRIELSRNFISEVYFAASVPEEQRDQIKTAIMANTAASPQAAATPPSTRFYQYIANRHSIRAHLPMDFLYDKSDGTTPRAKMTLQQVKELLDDPNYLDTLKDRFGFHDRHTGKLRTKEEDARFDQIIEWFNVIRDHKASHPDLSDAELTDIIECGLPSWPEQI